MLSSMESPESVKKVYKAKNTVKNQKGTLLIDQKAQ